MKLRRRRLVSLGVVAATAVVVVLVALIGLGYLVLPQSASAPITISETQWTILEGTNASGGYWFGPNTLSYPGLNGYPLSVAPGSTFGVPIVLWNHDNANHTVYSVLVGLPFTYVRSDPPVPIVVPAGEDSASFEFWVTAPSEPGASLMVTITINALNPS
jgi:hypothetical protein